MSDRDKVAIEWDRVRRTADAVVRAPGLGAWLVGVGAGGLWIAAAEIARVIR